MHLFREVAQLVEAQIAKKMRAAAPETPARPFGIARKSVLLQDGKPMTITNTSPAASSTVKTIAIGTD